ncbi:MAG TPA: pyridoxal phosphate-dependent aminotransferase [Candidatus Dormibacteraeota bacterium]|nr:pyridoxal phosphate-dependent aminotransferase [Candidatus Dormibacteraeota bacterium]
MFADRTNWNLEPNRLSEALARHRVAGKPLIDLTASNPTECGFTYDRERILSALADPQSLSYEPEPKGLLAAREVIVGYYADRGDHVAASDMLLTTSTSEAYAFVFRILCNPGDEVLIPTPSYPLFDLLADIQDVRLVRYPLIYDHGWQIAFHALEAALTPRTRAIIVVHPNNPTGHFVKPDERSGLNQICAGRQLAIIADEVFLDFALSSKRHLSWVANSEVLTFTMSGLSKMCGLPQMKAAWLAASGPKDLKTRALERLEVIADTYLSMNAPIQHAIPEFLQQRHEFQRQLMSRVRGNLAELDRQLATQKACGRREIEGGWYAVLRVPTTRTDEEVALDLLEKEGVYVHPGHFYDFPADGYLIVSLIGSEQEFGEGIRRLVSIF